jgi:hypothetical protein
MSESEFKEEVHFGLENLLRIHQRVQYIASQDLDKVVRLSALTYECFGYYNAVEHLILRFMKYLALEKPVGAFSHRETIRVLERLIDDYALDIQPKTLETCIELMAFRHVATKIYGFLIDESKLDVIVLKVQNEHFQITNLFEQLLNTVQQRK